MNRNNSSIGHIPVLLSNFRLIFPKISGVWVDGTFGFGGYSEYLLGAGASKLIAIDIDPEVKANVDRLKKKWPHQIDFFISNFTNMRNILDNLGIKEINGVILDVGISSMQIDKSLRGFSFKNNGPLDMRMSSKGPTAEEFINNAEEKLICEVIYEYGEEKRAKLIAKRIVETRKKQKIDTTYRLANIIEEVLGFRASSKIHPATKSFQAIRIAINNELQNLILGLHAAYKVLRIGGFLAVITFHSLEDRIVKRFFKLSSKIRNPLEEIKKIGGVSQPYFETLFKKPIVAPIDEIIKNPRSRSAKLRIVKKLSNEPLLVEFEKLGLPDLSKSVRKFQCE